jgi:hypothetical protein
MHELPEFPICWSTARHHHEPSHGDLKAKTIIIIPFRVIMQEGSQEGCKRFATVGGSVLPFGIQTQHTEVITIGSLLLSPCTFIDSYNC